MTGVRAQDGNETDIKASVNVHCGGRISITISSVDLLPILGEACTATKTCEKG